MNGKTFIALRKLEYVSCPLTIRLPCTININAIHVNIFYGNNASVLAIFPEEII